MTTSQSGQADQLMRDETQVVALISRLEKSVQNEEELKRNLDLEVTVRKRLRTELTEQQEEMAESALKLQAMDEMKVNQGSLKNSLKMLEQNLKAKEDQMKEQTTVIDEFKLSIEKRVDWTAEDAGGQNIAEASAQIRSLEKLQFLHEARSKSQQSVIANIETLCQKLREDLSTKTAECERQAVELTETTTALTEA